MKLPKVTARASLLNQITQHKVSSLPISPRIFEQAKFGPNSKQKNSFNNDSSLNVSGNQELNKSILNANNSNASGTQ